MECAAAPVAIVTGAARGIGAAVALRLAQEGNAVAVVDLDANSCRGTVDRIHDTGMPSIAVPCDVGDSGSVARAVRQVVDELGPPTILVNNAGITRDNLLYKMTDTEWDDVMQVHLRGAFLMSREVQSHMTQAGWGRIVNMSSVSALGNRGQANYAAAKAGLQGFTRTLAIELGKFGVTCNAIAPGFISTAMTEATAERLGIAFAQLKLDRASSTPVKRVGCPEDIAHAVAFFVSDDASFVTGQVLYVAGGPRS